MKRKTFEIESDLAEAFEFFCGERQLIEKRVVQSCLAHFMVQDAATREKILMTKYPPDCESIKFDATSAEGKVAAKLANPKRGPHPR